MTRLTFATLIVVLIVCSVEGGAQKTKGAPLTTTPQIGVTDLGTPDGTSAIGYAINDAGNIAGYTLGSNAFFWSRHTGFVTIGAGAFPHDINNRNQVVGQYQTSAGLSHGYLWDASTRVMQDLGEFVPVAINNRGDMAGSSYVDGEWHSFVYLRGRLLRIIVDDDTVAGVADINSKGVVVGTSRLRNGGNTRAYTWNERDGRIVMHPPDPYIASSGEAIDEVGRVFGLVAATDDYFLEPIAGTFWNPDGSVESVAATPSHDMVARGALNARRWTIRSGTKLWIDQFGPIDLPGLEGDRYAAANALNNRGEIVGGLPNSSGMWRLAVWTVRDSNTR